MLYVYPWEEFKMNEDVSYFRRFFGSEIIIEVWDVDGRWLTTVSKTSFATAKDAMMDVDIDLRKNGYQFIEPHEAERFRGLELLQ